MLHEISFVLFIIKIEILCAYWNFCCFLHNKSRDIVCFMIFLFVSCIIKIRMLWASSDFFCLCVIKVGILCASWDFIYFLFFFFVSDFCFTEFPSIWLIWFVFSDREKKQVRFHESVEKNLRQKEDGG